MRTELINEVLDKLSIGLGELSEEEKKQEFVNLLQNLLVLYKRKITAVPQYSPLPGMERAYILTILTIVE